MVPYRFGPAGTKFVRSIHVQSALEKFSSSVSVQSGQDKFIFPYRTSLV